MHCREAKRRMNKSTGKLDRETVEHIAGCPSCARKTEALKLLERVFESSGEDAYASTPLTEIREKIESGKQLRPYKENIMTRIKNSVKTRPAVFSGVGLAVLIFVIITVVPFPSKQVVGYNVDFYGVGQTNPDIDTKLTEAFNVLGYGSVPLNKTDSDYQIVNLPDKSSALKISTAFRAVTGFEGTARISPVVAKSSATLYAQVTDKEKYEYQEAEEKYEKAKEEFLTVTEKYKQAKKEFETQLRIKTVDGNYVLITSPGSDEESDDSGMIVIIGDNDSKYYATIRGQTIEKLDSAGLSELYGLKTVGDDLSGVVMLKVIQDDEDVTELVELYIDSYGGAEQTFSDVGLVELEVDTRGKTSDEIKAELNNKLQSLGIDDTIIHVVKLNDRTVILLSNDEVTVK